MTEPASGSAAGTPPEARSGTGPSDTGPAGTGEPTATTATAAGVLASYVPAVRALAERWLVAVERDPDVRAAGGDFACSPTGVWLTLSAAAAGARGGTARELEGLLGAAGARAAQAASDATRALAETDAVAVATGMWSRTPVYRAFRESLPDIRFGQFDPADPSAVDAWVREATGGLVGRLPGAMAPDTLLLLVNALALKAKWAAPFKRQDTKDRAFTDASGVAHQVPTMFKRLPQPGHAWTVEGPSGDTVEVVAMRCLERPGRQPGQAGAPAQVSFVLGAPGRTAAEVLPAAWAPAGRRRPVEADRVTIALPRLSLRTQLDVARHLEPLGAGQVRSTHADFSGLSPEPLRISAVVQESLVKVDELGVEAAARTEAHFTTRSAQTAVPRIRHIAFDRPFGIVIFDGPSGIPLFTAWQSAAPRAD